MQTPAISSESKNPLQPLIRKIVPPMSQQKDPKTVVILCRLSYPSLFKKKVGRDKDGNPQGEPAFAACGLIPKIVNGVANPDIEKLRNAAKAAKQEKWQGKPVNLTGSCLRDGVEKEATEGYGPSVMFISARNTKPIRVVDRNLGDLTEDSGKLYAGCWVNMEVRAWAQDNANGKRINWSLQKVQRVRDDKPFGEKQTPVEETFANLGDDDSGVDSPAGAGSSANDQI
jgi:hypothetical protein